jgi:GTP pyrophosphokinase
MVERVFSQENHPFAERGVEQVLVNFRQTSIDDLFVQVGMGNVTARSVLEAVFPAAKRHARFYDRVVPLRRARRRPEPSAQKSLPIQGLIPGMAVHYAACCHPLPGDRIVGIVTTGRGVTIHTIDCEGLAQYANAPERWIDVGWNAEPDSDAVHVGRLAAAILNQPGSLSVLTSVIAKSDGNIINLKIVNRSEQFFEILVDVEVVNAQHLSEISASLRASPAIISVDRVRR